jgi:hypothetical protein
VADICRGFFDRTAALTSDNHDDRTMRILYEHVLTADAQIKTVLKSCASYLRLKVEEPVEEHGVLSIQRTTFLISVHNKVCLYLSEGQFLLTVYRFSVCIVGFF